MVIARVAQRSSERICQAARFGVYPGTPIGRNQPFRKTKNPQPRWIRIPASSSLSWMDSSASFLFPRHISCSCRREPFPRNMWLVSSNSSMPRKNGQGPCSAFRPAYRLDWGPLSIDIDKGWVAAHTDTRGKSASWRDAFLTAAFAVAQSWQWIRQLGRSWLLKSQTLTF